MKVIKNIKHTSMKKLIILFLVIFTACKKESLPELTLPYTIDGQWVLGDVQQHFKQDGEQVYAYLPDSFSVYVNNIFREDALITSGETIEISDNILRRDEKSFKIITKQIGYGCEHFETQGATDSRLIYKVIYCDTEVMLLEVNGTPFETMLLEYLRPGVFNVKNDIKSFKQKTSECSYDAYTTGKQLTEYRKDTFNFTPSNLIGKWVFESYQYISPYGGSKEIIGDTLEFYNNNTYRYNNVIKPYYSSFGGVSVNYICLTINMLDILGTIRTTELPTSFNNTIDVRFTTDAGRLVRVIWRKL